MAAGADGYIRIDTKIDQRGAQAGLSELMGSLKGFAAAVGIAFGVAAIVRFGKACIDVASDLNEVQNVIDVTFGASQDQVNKFAETAATAFGLSQLAAKQYTGTMGAMLKSMGFTTDQAADMSIELAGLAGDMASFYNLDSSDAFDKLRSGISGETEPLKQLGINLSQANLEAYALANGFGAGYAALDEQTKALIRYQYILSATKDAQGDFARTSDSWANQVRILQLQFESLKATLGGAFIAVLTPVLQIINRVLAALNGAATVFAKFIAAVTGRSQEVTTASTAAAAATDAAAAATDGLTKSTAASGKAAEKAGKQAKKGLANFDELNVLAGGRGEGLDGGKGAGIGAGAGPAVSTDTVGTDTAPAIPTEDKLGFFDKYAEQIGRVKASWDELKDTVANLFAGIKAQTEATDIKGAAFDAVLDILYALIETANLVITVVGDLILAFNVPATIEAGLRLIGDVFQFIGDVVDAITPGVKAFVDEALVPIAAWAGEKVRDAMAFLGEQLGKIGAWFQEHKEDFKVLGQNLGEAAAAAWKLIEPLADAAWEIFKDAISKAVDMLLAFGDWCLEHQETITNLAIVVGSVAAAWWLVNAAIGAWNVISAIAAGTTGALVAASTALFTVMAFLTSPVVLVTAAIALLIAGGVLLVKNWEDIEKGASDVWGRISTFFDTTMDTISGFFSDVWGGIQTTVGGIWDALSTKANEVWTPISTFFSTTLSGIEGFFNTTWANVQTAWQNVSTWFTNNVTGPVEKVFGTFKTNAGKIWEDVGLGIKGTLNTIIGGVEKFVNGTIKGINWLIDGLNDIIDMGGDVAEALGFGGFPHIPTIGAVSLPKLAQGAVIPPNREFAAILGDQRSGVNIETPLATMLDAFRQAIAEMGGLGGTGEIVINVTSELDGREIARSQARYLPNEQRRIGKSVIKVGG